MQPIKTEIQSGNLRGNVYRRIIANTVPVEETRQRLLEHKPGEWQPQQRRGTSVSRPKRVRRVYFASPGLLRSNLLQSDSVALPRRLVTRRSG